MSEELTGDMVFDTSVLLELIGGSRAGRRLSELLKADLLRPLTTEINVAELRYILCRKVGQEQSKDVVEKLISSGYLRILPINDIAEEASLLKCRRAISLVDCFTIALGGVSRSRVLFAKHEQDLDKEIRKTPFGTTILFLQDLIQ